MSLIKRPDRDAHWYTTTGEARHTVTGKSTGLPRPTNVTDARKESLIPSVTNILGMKAKPALNVWLQDNAILAALATPRNPGEEEGDWHTRIAAEADRVGREAAEWGTLLHEQVEQFNTGGAFMGTGEILDYVAGYEAWHREHVVTVIAAEQSVVGNGYAGRLDLHAIIRHEGRERRAILDLKSQKLKGKPKANFYGEWAMQLAAYAAPLTEPGEEPPLLVSLVMPSDKPGPIQPKVWDNGAGALKAFHACLELWCWEKNYDPREVAK